MNPSIKALERDRARRYGPANQDEYAFGLNPALGSSVNPITMPLDKATGAFTYSRRTPGLTGLGYTV
ncbi:MAG: hypothetical protein K9N23_09745 [Akkermansiaceae bacterium]|nr:hypothetical protein [Akkermansiaceae bacterium]